MSFKSSIITASDIQKAIGGVVQEIVPCKLSLVHRGLSTTFLNCQAIFNSVSLSVVQRDFFIEYYTMNC